MISELSNGLYGSTQYPYILWLAYNGSGRRTKHNLLCFSLQIGTTTD